MDQMRLYHYLSIEHAVDDLVKRRIKISKYTELNDPFELLGTSLSDSPYERILETEIKKGGVVCFSETDSEPLLWSHYAQKHKGCCIGFDVADIDGLCQTIPIKKPKQVFVDMSHFAEAAQKAKASSDLEFGPSRPMVQKRANELEAHTNSKMLSKYEGWSYERERRLLIKLIPSQKDGDHYFADFDDILKPIEVLLGARCIREDEEKLRYAVNRYDPPLRIIRTALAKDVFEIIRRDEVP
jgi:hypothetical protein